MVMFSKETMAKLKQQADDIRKATSFDGSRDKWIGLTGKNAIVAPGGDVDIRILPRRDFAAKRYAKRGGKIVDLMKTDPPEYMPEVPWLKAYEHWIDGADGKPSRRWCRRTLGQDEPCPACEYADQLLVGTDEEKEQGRRVRARDAYVMAVILRGKEYGDDGTPAVKLLSVGGTVYLDIINKCTGGGDDKYALGDVSDWQAGYDLKIHRPEPNVKGARYMAIAEPRPSPLHAPEHKDRWKGLFTGELIPDLEASVLPDVESYEAIYKWVYGVDPEAGDVPTEPAAPEVSGGDDAPFEVPGEEAGTGEAEAAGDEDPFAGFAMPGEDGEPAQPEPPAKPTAKLMPKPPARPAPQPAKVPAKPAGKSAPAKPVMRRPTR